MSTAEYFEAMDRARDFSGRTGEDIQVIDDGVDITSHLATRNDPAYFDSVCFITEQTTCGVAGLEHLYERGLLPVPAINRTVYSLCQGALTNLIAGRATHRLS